MAELPSKTFTAEDGSTDEVYFRGHPRYDAVRVEFDSGKSDSTDVDVEVKVDGNDEVNDASFGSMDASVYTDTGINPSSGYPTTGTTSMGRIVAVQVTEQDTADGGESASGTVYLHPADDPAQNADSFANR